MTTRAAAGRCADSLPMDDLAANLSASARGMEALMDLLACVPDDHHVRTQALHALMMPLADQVGQAAHALKVVRQRRTGR